MDTKIFQILSIRFSIKITYLLSRAHTIYHEERFFFKREKERLRCFERKLGRSTMSVNLLENYTARETVIKVLIKIMFAYDRSPSMQWCVLQLHTWREEVQGRPAFFASVTPIMRGSRPRADIHPSSFVHRYTRVG